MDVKPVRLYISFDTICNYFMEHGNSFVKQVHACIKSTPHSSSQNLHRHVQAIYVNISKMFISCWKKETFYLLKTLKLKRLLRLNSKNFFFIFLLWMKILKGNFIRDIQYIAKRYHFFMSAQSWHRRSFNNCVIYFKNIPSCRKFNSVQGSISNFSIDDLSSGHKVELCMIFQIGRRKKISLFHIFVKIWQFRDELLILVWVQT